MFCIHYRNLENYIKKIHVVHSANFCCATITDWDLCSYYIFCIVYKATRSCILAYVNEINILNRSCTVSGIGFILGLVLLCRHTFKGVCRPVVSRRTICEHLRGVLRYFKRIYLNIVQMPAIEMLPTVWVHFFIRWYMWAASL